MMKKKMIDGKADSSYIINQQVEYVPYRHSGEGPRHQKIPVSTGITIIINIFFINLFK